MEVDGNRTEDRDEKEEDTDSDDAAENADGRDVRLALCNTGNGDQDDGNNLCTVSVRSVLASHSLTR